MVDTVAEAKLRILMVLVLDLLDNPGCIEVRDRVQQAVQECAEVEAHRNGFNMIGGGF